MASSASGKVEKGHQLYRDGKYKEALLFYTEALSAAKSKSQKIALHSNRAACYLKLHDFKQVLDLLFLFYSIKRESPDTDSRFFFLSIEKLIEREAKS